MKIGDSAKLIQPVVSGQIIDTEYDKENLCLRHCLEWADASGNTSQRWFIESELEAVNE